MDFFQHRYYRLSKIFMMLCGSWPYQSTRTRWVICVILGLMFITRIVPQILAVVKYRNEWAIIMESIPVFLFLVTCTVKHIFCMRNVRAIMELLNRIRTNWQVWARDQEVYVLHKYADQGRKMSFAFTAQIYSTIFIYVAQPTIPKIIDVLLKNGTAVGEFPCPMEYYYFDSQKYYFYIVLHFYVCDCCNSIFFVASENMLFIYVQHVCSILAALGCKLQRIGNNNISVQSGGTSRALDERFMEDLASWVDKHNDAIDCANLIENTYTWPILYVAGCGTIMFSLVGLQILLRRNDAKLMVRFIGTGLAIVLHLYTECYLSQFLTDHSNRIHLYIYNSQWYKVAPKLQKLLQLMILRCRVPCKLTAGHFFVLSMRTFQKTMQACISYFTVARSMQM